MVGREAYQNPGILAAVDREIFGSLDIDADPVAVVRAMYPYISVNSARDASGHITRHMRACSRVSRARQWRRYLSENAHKAGADIMCWNTRSNWWWISVNFSPKNSQIHHARAPSRGVLLLNQ
ncbi:tRNA-dihydrouridine synthase [Shigella boydii]